jgi:hypothetical protein
MFVLIVATIFVASTVNWLNDFISTIPIKEVDEVSRLYIRKDLENGRIY